MPGLFCRTQVDKTLNIDKTLKYRLAVVRFAQFNSYGGVCPLAPGIYRFGFPKGETYLTGPPMDTRFRRYTARYPGCFTTG